MRDDKKGFVYVRDSYETLIEKILTKSCTNGFGRKFQSFSVRVQHRLKRFKMVAISNNQISIY